MQDETFFKLAKKAAADPSFIAHLVEKQATREKASWHELAKLLDISAAQLAKLALCKRPRDEYYTQDIAQIVGYSGINRIVLMHFLDSAQKGTMIKRQATQAGQPSLPTDNRNKKRVFSMISRRTWAIGLAAMLVLFLGAFVLAQPGETEATLVVSSGDVVVNQAGGAIFAGVTETAVSAGEAVTVREGDTIRLNETAAAQLRLQDGSTVDLFSGSTVAVTEMVYNDDSFRFQLNLLTGKTLSRVVRLLRSDDTFEIKTPSSTASVRGTVFTVETQGEDSTHVMVEEGIVRVALGDASVDVQAGFQVTAVVGQPLQVESNNPATATPTDEPTAVNTPEATDEPTATATDTPTATAVPTEEDEEVEPSPTPAPSDTPEEEDETDDAESEKVVICHYPGGDLTKGNTIEIDADSLADHLAHGDIIGECPLEPVPTSTPLPAPTSTPLPAPTNTPAPAPTNTPVPEEKITICHNGNTIEINADSWADHEAHGDTLGACP